MPRLARVIAASLFATVFTVGCGSKRAAQIPEEGDEQGEAPADAGSDRVLIGDAEPGGGDGACATSRTVRAVSAVDFIWVVDDSGSMAEEIGKINSNINDHFATIIGASSLDYRVIVISNRGHGPFSICVEPPLGGIDCADAPPRFHQLDCDVESSDSLDILWDSYLGTSTRCQGTWSGWIRPDATKVFIEVTDDAPVAWSGALSPADELDERLLSPQTGGAFGTAADRNYVFNAICGLTTGDPTKRCPTAVDPGDEYQKLASLTGGEALSICEDDWSSLFQQLAGGVVERLGCEFNLPASDDGSPIDPNTVNVVYKPQGHEPGLNVLRDDTAPCAGGADGWQWNQDKTKIILCGPICESVKGDPTGEVDVLVGCQTNTRSPH